MIDSFLTQPNMYARGILFGKMKYELGDHSYVKCPELHLSADIEFKVKGYFSGTYNAIGGTIKDDRTGQVLYELSGMWNREMIIKDVTVSISVSAETHQVTHATRPVTKKFSSMQDMPSLRLLKYGH